MVPGAALAEIVTTEVATPEPGVMLAGEKEQLIVLGMPLQLSAIELLNDPDCAFAVTVRLPVVPAEIVRDAGDALRTASDSAWEAERERVAKLVGPLHKSP